MGENRFEPVEARGGKSRRYEWEISVSVSCKGEDDAAGGAPNPSDKTVFGEAGPTLPV